MPSAAITYRVRISPSPSTATTTESPSAPAGAAEAGEAAAVVDLRAGCPSQREQRVVELRARHHGGVRTGTFREREADFVAGRGANPRLADREPRVGHRRRESERFEQSQRARRQAVAAALVARERRLVDERDVPAGPGEHDRRRAAGRAAADHEDVGVEHGLQATGAPTSRRA
jgi:hypothetical protein